MRNTTIFTVMFLLFLLFPNVALAKISPAEIVAQYNSLDYLAGALYHTGSEELSTDEILSRTAKILSGDDIPLKASAVYLLGEVGNREYLQLIYDALKDDDNEVRYIAVKALDKWRLSESVPVLIGILDDPDKKVKRAAMQALGKMGDSRAFPVFITAIVDGDYQALRMLPMVMEENRDQGVSVMVDLLRGSNSRMRDEARQVLLRIGGEDVFNAVIPLLTDPDHKVRYQAVKMIGESGRETDIPYLIKSLHDDHKRVKLTAIEQLEHTGNIQAISELLTLLRDSGPVRRKDIEKSLASMFKKAGDTAKDIIIRGIDDPDKHIRRVSLLAYIDLYDKDAIPILIKALNDSESIIRVIAAETLGEKGARSAVPALRQSVSDSQMTVRLAAVKSLITLGNDEFIPEMVKLLDESDNDMKLNVIAAIEDLGNKETTALLFGVLNHDDKDVRKAANEAFKITGDKSHLPRLFGMLDNEEINAYRIASGILERGSDRQSLLLLIDMIKGSNEKLRERRASWLLSDYADSSIIPELVELIGGSDREFTISMIIKMGRLGGDEAVKTLINIVWEHGDDEVQAVATSVLGRIGGDEAVKGLIKIVQEHKNDDIRGVATFSLGQTGDETAIPVMIKSIERIKKLDPSQDTYGVSSLFAKMRDQRILPYFIKDLNIEEMSGDADDKVREDAFEILIRMGGEEMTPAVRQTLIKSYSNIQYFQKDRWVEVLDDTKLFYDLFIATSDIKILRIIKNKMIFPDSFDLLTTSSDKFLKASGYYLMALKAREEGRHEDQLKYADMALNLLNSKKRAGLYIMTLWLKAHSEIKLGMNDLSITTISSAENLFDYLSLWEKESFKELFVEYSLFMKGEALSESGRKKDAFKAFNDSLRMLEKYSRYSRGYRISNDIENRLEVMILTSLGALQIKMGRENLQKAVKGGRDFDTSDSVEMDNEEKRYLELARQRAAEGEYEEAQKLIEELNLRRTKYINRKMNLRLADPEKQVHMEEYSKRQKEIEDINRKISEIDESSGEIKQLEKEKNRKKRDLKKYLTKLKKSHPDIAALLGAKPMELSAIQEQLPDDTVVLQYMMLPDKLIVFVLTNEGIEIVETQTKKKDLKTLTRKLRREINTITKGKNSKKIGTLASEMNDLLIKPVEEEGYLKGIKVVGISPNGFLHQLPFGVLINENSSYLIDRYNLFFINSTSILGIAMEKRNNSDTDTNGFLAFSNPDGTLENSDIEIEQIAKLFNEKSTYSQENAKKSLIQNKDKAYSILHLATHGMFDAIDSSKSYLVMSDGNLSVEEIWGLPLKGITLTVLSACETGIGEVLSGDDVVSLENAFIYAGSPSVVATLWQVEDRSMAQLMEYFYQNLITGMTKTAALSEAQKTIKKKYPHPFFWAAVTLRGDWR